MTIIPYTIDKIPAVIDYERRLREEEPFFCWDIGEKYQHDVALSFSDPRFDSCISLLAEEDGKIIGRIDCALIPSRFDGSIKAYLDWICVLRSFRHKGVAQALINELKLYLKEQSVDTLIALTASNEEAQRFYRSIPDSEMKDTGIWIDIR